MKPRKQEEVRVHCFSSFAILRSFSFFLSFVLPRPFVCSLSFPRKRESIFFDLQQPFVRASRWVTLAYLLRQALVALLLTLTFATCATTQPVRLDARDVAANPQTYANQRVELTGYILDYQPPAGDTYRTWNFTFGLSPTEKFAVSVAGYTAASIAKASRLAERAYRNQEPVTVVGKLKVDSKAGVVTGDGAAVAQAVRAELKLESIECKGEKINVTAGPRSQPGLSVGGWYFTPSIGIGATITP
ncbi:hypothetical protein HZA56_12060 [Candidatus Poribacteria bacterium]|nr:hypothetical protein [Candidatus Poribacteria bacterium]